MKDLNELQFFVQLSQAQSFTLAAKQLGVPKSSVSRAILRLERRLGIRLVERTTRRVALTEAGALYLERCRRMMEEAEQADLLISAFHARPRGRLRVGAPMTFARFVLGSILGEFLALYPELRLRLQLLGADASPREKDLDVVIRAGPLENSALLVRPLMRIPLAAYASPRYLEDHGVPDSPADLQQHSCVTTSCGVLGEPGDTTTWQLRCGSNVHEVRVESRASVPDPTISHQLAVAGAGVALLSQSMAREDVGQGRLVRLLPDWEPEPIVLYALYPARLSSSPSVRVFIEFLRESFDGDSPVDMVTPKQTVADSSLVRSQLVLDR